MKVYKFVHVQMNEFPEGNVNHHGVLFYKIIL